MWNNYGLSQSHYIAINDWVSTVFWGQNEYLVL